MHSFLVLRVFHFSMRGEGHLEVFVFYIVQYFLVILQCVWTGWADTTRPPMNCPARAVQTICGIAVALFLGSSSGRKKAQPNTHTTPPHLFLKPASDSIKNRVRFAVLYTVESASKTCFSSHSIFLHSKSLPASHKNGVHLGSFSKDWFPCNNCSSDIHVILCSLSQRFTESPVGLAHPQF